jgi:hypothetical protein
VIESNRNYDFDVLADGVVVGRIMRAAPGAPEGTLWLWTLAFGHHEHPDARLRGDARGRDGGSSPRVGEGSSK